MINVKTIGFSAIIVLGAWAVAATIGLGALAIASSAGPVAPSASVTAPAIDAFELTMKARNLPVEIAPAP